MMYFISIHGWCMMENMIYGYGILFMHFDLCDAHLIFLYGWMFVYMHSYVYWFMDVIWYDDMLIEDGK